MSAVLETLPPTVIFALGLLLVLIGGDRFTDGAVKLSVRLGVPEVVVGATLVSLATTLPELATSLTAVYQGAPDLAVGNALGSVITNLGLILAAGALIAPMALDRPSARITSMALATAAFGTWLLMSDGTLSQRDGLVLLAGGALFYLLRVRSIMRNRQRGRRAKGAAAASSRSPHVEVTSPGGRQDAGMAGPVGWFVLGAALVIAGSHLLVDGGMALARLLGVSELIIGLTLVALGTSLPELIVAVASGLKGHPQISAGNLLGASLLNLVLVLAAAAVVTPLTTGLDVRSLTVPVMTALAVMLAVASLWRGRLDRLAALALILIYGGYLFWVISTGQPPT